MGCPRLVNNRGSESPPLPLRLYQVILWRCIGVRSDPPSAGPRLAGNPGLLATVDIKTGNRLNYSGLSAVGEQPRVRVSAFTTAALTGDFVWMLGRSCGVAVELVAVAEDLARVATGRYFGKDGVGKVPAIWT